MTQEKAWRDQLVRPNCGVGDFISLAFLADGNPAVCYFRAVGEDLEYAWYTGKEWRHTPVEVAGKAGEYCSLAVFPKACLDAGLRGKPAISYFDAMHADLKFAWFDGSRWARTTVDEQGTVGISTTLAFLPSGQPVISYHADTNEDLKFAWHEGTNLARGWHTVTVDPDGDSGWNACMTLQASGQPIISYYRDWAPLGDLKIAWHEGLDFNTGWSTALVDASPDCDVGRLSSIAVLSDGQPVIAYEDQTHGSLKYASHEGQDFGTGWKKVTLAPQAAAVSSVAAVMPTDHFVRIPLKSQDGRVAPADMSSFPVVCWISSDDVLRLGWPDTQGSWHSADLPVHPARAWRSIGLVVPAAGPYAHKPCIACFADGGVHVMTLP